MIARRTGSVLVVLGVVGVLAWLWLTVRSQNRTGGIGIFFGEADDVDA